MRSVLVTWVSAAALIIVPVSASSQTSTRAPGRAPAARGSAAKRSVPARPAPSVDGRRPPEVFPPDLTDDDGRGEALDGPDAFEHLIGGNGGLIVGPRTHRGAGRLRMRAMMERRRELSKRLDLTESQRDRIQSIRDRQKRLRIEQRAKIRIARLDLATMLRGERLDRTAVEAKSDEISRLQAQLRRARLDMMLDVRGVLTPEQQRKLRTLRDDAGGGAEI